MKSGSGHKYENIVNRILFQLHVVVYATVMHTILEAEPYPCPSSKGGNPQLLEWNETRGMRSTNTRSSVLDGFAVIANERLS